MLEIGRDFTEKWMDDEVRKSLEKYHAVFRSGNEVKPEIMKEYQALILTVLKRLIQ